MALMRELEYLKVPFGDIRVGTGYFKTIIGRGGFGPVYKGELSISGNLTSVAVKRLPNISLSGQGQKEFLTELQLLSRCKHPNLISLLGYWEDEIEKILIYKYAGRGSLADYLNTANTKCPLTWNQRLHICVDAARGLDYLHNHVAADHRIIHRDIKSANILIDENWKAMIADLGLAKIGRANEDVTYVITNLGGTGGYCDPAYMSTGILTKESDVYSFGVVLIEALCGKLCYKKVPGKNQSLLQLAKECYPKGKLYEIMDVDCKDSKSVEEFSKIAYQCLNAEQKARPSMDVVLEKLEYALKLLEKEEASELQKREEALRLQKYEEAYELQKFEEALGLQKLVETLQAQEMVEALVLQELDEAFETQELEETLELHKIGEMLELQKDYAVIKAIHMMSRPPPVYDTKEELYKHLSTGFFVDDGKVWFSIDENGYNQEMISAIKFMHLQPQKYEAAYLICRDVYSRDEDRVITSLKYKLNNQGQSYTSYRGEFKDRTWLMMELFQTRSAKRNVEFKVLLEEFHSSRSCDRVIVEGIVFLPIQKFDDETIKIQEVENPPMTGVEWESHLPSDYEQFIYHSGKKMLNRPPKCVVTETKEEAYSILSKGVYIKVEDDIDVFFWITNSNGKKCFMLSPKSVRHDPHVDKFELAQHPNESRFKYVLELSSSSKVRMQFKIINPLLSSNTIYTCYLVYKISERMENPVSVMIKLLMLRLPPGERMSGKGHHMPEKTVYLSIPQSPVIGIDGAETSRATMSKSVTVEFPRKRNDGWLEVRLGDFIKHNIQDFRPWIHRCIPCFPYANDINEDAYYDDTKFARLYPDYDPSINIYMDWSDTHPHMIPNLTVQGIEFRPL